MSVLARLAAVRHTTGELERRLLCLRAMLRAFDILTDARHAAHLAWQRLMLTITCATLLALVAVLQWLMFEPPTMVARVVGAVVCSAALVVAGLMARSTRRLQRQYRAAKARVAEAELAARIARQDVEHGNGSGGATSIEPE